MTTCVRSVITLAKEVFTNIFFFFYGPIKEKGSEKLIKYLKYCVGWSGNAFYEKRGKRRSETLQF